LHLEITALPEYQAKTVQRLHFAVEITGSKRSYALMVHAE